MDGLRGEMSTERLLVINQAFDHIDENFDGDLAIGEIAKKFRCRNHPAILDKTATKEQVLKEFLSQWDKARADGSIDREDFIAFYADVGAAIQNDEDFEYVLRAERGRQRRSCWGSTTGGTACVLSPPAALEKKMRGAVEGLLVVDDGLDHLCAVAAAIEEMRGLVQPYALVH